MHMMIKLTHHHIALLNGKEDVAVILIKKFGCDPYVKGYLGRSLLHSACCGGNINLVRTLIHKHHEDLKCHDNQNNAPLHVAALSGREEIVIALINEFKCDPNARGFEHGSLLHLACAGGNANTVRSICKFTSPLIVDANGDTPLHTCSALDHTDCVKTLLSNGAPILTRNNSGKTPIDIANGSAKVFLDDYVKDHKGKIYHEYDTIQDISRKKYCGAERITRVFVIGNPGAGKSSLVETLKREDRLNFFRTVSETSVPPHTADIIPSIYRSKHYGRVLFYDFAGDPEYYSSHAAILENLEGRQ